MYKPPQDIWVWLELPTAGSAEASLKLESLTCKSGMSGPVQAKLLPSACNDAYVFWQTPAVSCMLATGSHRSQQCQACRHSLRHLHDTYAPKLCMACASHSMVHMQLQNFLQHLTAMGISEQGQCFILVGPCFTGIFEICQVIHFTAQQPGKLADHCLAVAMHYAWVL